MEEKINKIRYNAVGYHPMIDYRNDQYNKNINAIKPLLQDIITTNTRALDLGCNAGKYSFMMEDLGATVTGIDFANNALNIAREIADDLESSCTFIHGDILDMSFTNNSFDLVLFPLNIIEFDYEEIDILCNSIKNILKPKGVFCITMQDGLGRIECGRDTKDKYDISNGRHIAVQNIPEKGIYKYRTYFWTVAFAKYVIGRYFDIADCVEHMENRYYLKFINNK